MNCPEFSVTSLVHVAYRCTMTVARSRNPVISTPVTTHPISKGPTTLAKPLPPLRGTHMPYSRYKEHYSRSFSSNAKAPLLPPASVNGTGQNRIHEREVETWLPRTTTPSPNSRVQGHPTPMEPRREVLREWNAPNFTRVSE